MRIAITMDIDTEFADPGHAMGVTEAGFDAICERLCDMGTDIVVSNDEGTDG